MSREWLPMVGVLALSALSVGLMFLGSPPTGPLTADVATILVLVAPGYATSAALLTLGSIETAERLVISVGLSLAVAIFSGLILNLTPGGLTRESWTTLLVGVTVTGALVAFRRGRVTMEGSSPSYWITLPQVALFLMAALLAVGALVVATVGEQIEPQPAFTELWMLPSVDGASVAVGISNHERAPQTYLLRVRLGQDVLYSQQVEVLLGADWEMNVALPEHASRSLIVSDIYLGEDVSRPYREVTMWTPG